MNTIYEDKELAQKLAEAQAADKAKKEQHQEFDQKTQKVVTKPEKAPEHQAL